MGYKLSEHDIVDFGEKEVTAKPWCQRASAEENEELLYPKPMAFTTT